MRVKKIVKSTTNRGEFNRGYKEYLERKAKIHCSYCGYHRGENDDGKKMYGGWGENIHHPNWKLASKHKKQWMSKPLKIRTGKRLYNNEVFTYINFKWERSKRSGWYT